MALGLFRPRVPWRQRRRMEVRHGGRRKEFARWPRRRVFCWWRELFLATCLLPLFRIAYRIDIRGRENWKSVESPCLVVSNHNMHLDWGILMSAMPGSFRRRLMVAAAATDIFGNPIRRIGVQVVGNAFPFDKQGGGIRDSLEFVTEVLEDGWNVLIYPEGKLTVAGPMEPFKAGVGWLVAHTEVDVVPMRIDVIRPGGYDGKWWPHPRGHVRVSIGAPIRPAPMGGYGSVVAELEKAVIEA